VPTNNFAQNDAGVNSPFTRALAITASDTTDLAEIPRALNVHKGTGGTVTAIKVTMVGDSVPVTLNLNVGAVFPIRVSRVWANGTDATQIIALY